MTIEGWGGLTVPARYWIAAVAALAFTVALIASTFAGEMPDKDKWHVGETNTTIAVFCSDVETTKKLLSLRVQAAIMHAPYDVFVAAAASLGCHQYPGPVTFHGAAEGTEPIVEPRVGVTFIICKFSNPGGEAYTYVADYAISDKPYEATPVIPQIWHMPGGRILLPATEITIRH